MKKLVFGLLILIFCISCNQSDNNNSFMHLSGPYLGQEPPGDTAEIFAPGFISTGYNEHGVSFSPDGKEMYYRLMDDRFSVIVTLKEINGQWTKHEVAPFSGRYGAKSSLSPDGKTMLYSSSEPSSGFGPANNYWSIWMVKREGDGWAKPINLPHLIGACPTMANNGNIYFFNSRENGKGDIYVSFYTDGLYSEAEKVKGLINTEEWENDPYVAPDESYIIFQSDRDDPTTYGELFVSFKGLNGEWTEPINLGPGINSDISGEGCPWVSSDGKYLFFSQMKRKHPRYFENEINYESMIELLNSPGGDSEDVMWVDASIIQKLKPDYLK